MGISIFLAKAIGLYCFIVGFGLLVNGKKIRPLLHETVDNYALSFVSGFIALILGVLLVTSHNIWVADWRVVITIVAWTSLMKGIILVAFTEATLDASQKWVKNDFAYYLSAVFILLVGIFLLYHGYI
jgi:hypothetical protein